MGSVCISNCVNDARVPMRATYVNLYKWPESDAEFVRSVSKKENRGDVINHNKYCHPKVVDSISCRQMYLRSYTFSVKKETVPEKAKKCFGKVKETLVNSSTGRRRRRRKVPVNGTRKCAVLKKVKELSCAALFSFFHKLLACSASVDVVDGKDF